MFSAHTRAYACACSNTRASKNMIEIHAHAYYIKGNIFIYAHSIIYIGLLIKHLKLFSAHMRVGARV